MTAQIALRPLGILAVVTLVLTAAGCGGGSGPTFKVTPVKGKVTMGGQPLADAQVSLMLQGQPPAGYPGSGGKTDAQGNFEVMTGAQKGVPAGKYTVVVSKVVGADGKPLVEDSNSTSDKGMMMAEGKVKDLIPAPYNDAGQSQTNVTVTAGTPVPDVTIAIP
jgi:hypothetical protein